MYNYISSVHINYYYFLFILNYFYKKIFVLEIKLK